MVEPSIKVSFSVGLSIGQKSHIVEIGSIKIGGDHPFVLISGPCVIESRDHCFDMAGRLKEVTAELKVPFIFKASYDKANRTSVHSFRGPGIEEGLQILDDIKEQFQLPILSDVHDVSQVDSAKEVLDVIQIPAFLSRQTDLIIAAASTGKCVNVKKGQFLAPLDVKNIIDKVRSANNDKVMITERGFSFGYNNLVVDFKSLPMMRGLGFPVIFDATHSVQLPGGDGKSTLGQAEFIPYLARGAVAVGVDGIFIEVHDRPERALSDGANALQIDQMESILDALLEIDRILIKKSTKKILLVSDNSKVSPY